MNGRERIREAMSHGKPDRVPVMCQLSIGHYLLNTDVSPARLWFSSEGFADALIQLAQKYKFDGILINLPGRPENWNPGMKEIIRKDDGTEVVHWENGEETICPPDDNPHHDSAGRWTPPSLDEIDPASIYYLDHHVPCSLKYPYSFESVPYPGENIRKWPEYFFRTIDLVRERVAGELSVHSEVFSPFSQFLELFGYQDGLVYLLDYPDKCHAILAALAEGTEDLITAQVSHGVDAVLISSAFAGAGFISRSQYQEFVLPYEKQAVEKGKLGGAPFVYTHTCGAIGDRLDLMLETGTDGIDTLDPPPLGTVDLAEAKQKYGQRVFFKGNIDSVNTLLAGDVDLVRKDAEMRVKIGKEGGGYILSSACSVAPGVKPENIMVLDEVAREFGKY